MKKTLHVSLLLATALFVMSSVGLANSTPSALSTGATLTQNLAKESRVILDEDFYWATSKAATDQILTKIKYAGFNVYMPTVWHGRWTHYPNKLAPIDPRLSERILSRKEDPLAYLIQRAHEMDIEVHPWFTVMRRESDLFPRWRAKTGTNEEAYDVHNSDFRAFIVELMLDVVRRYAVDGVNLDYIRSMGVCTNDSCKDDYEKKFKRSLDAELRLQRLPLYKSNSIEQWNRDDVTDLVRKFSTGARILRPGLIISVDAAPLNPDALLQGQDAIGWVNAGLIDVVFNMDYSRKIDVDLVNRAKASMKVPSKLITIFRLSDFIDNRVFPRDPKVISGYVAQTRQLWPQTGIAFYLYQELTDIQSEALRAGVFNKAAIPSWTTSRK